MKSITGKNAKTVTSMILGVFLLVTPGLSQSTVKRPHAHGRPDHMMRQHPFHKLDLSEEQKQAVREIRKKHREQSKKEIEAILTDEQKEKLKQIKKERRSKRERIM